MNCRRCGTSPCFCHHGDLLPRAAAEGHVQGCACPECRYMRSEINFEKFNELGEAEPASERACREAAAAEPVAVAIADSEPGPFTGRLREFRLEGPPGADYVCRASITAVGLDNATEGAGVVVQARLTLPTTPDGEFLRPDLRFPILGLDGRNKLSAYTHASFRDNFHAPTWAAASRKAEIALLDMVVRLQVALLERKSAYYSEGREILTLTALHPEGLPVEPLDIAEWLA